jgi:hypothetical protein
MDPSFASTAATHFLALLIGSGTPLPAPVGPQHQDRLLPPPAAVAAQANGMNTPQNVERTSAYYRRLDVHRAASYTMLPLFALQYAAGRRLYDESSEAPAWAKTGHRVGATGIALLFATNLATGVPNLVAIRKDPRDRGRRTFHASMMLLASAGFLATGLLSESAETSPDNRDLHRNVALASVGIATIGYFSMLDFFRGN